MDFAFVILHKLLENKFLLPGGKKLFEYFGRPDMYLPKFATVLKILIARLTDP